MLGLLILYFAIIKPYRTLAEKFNKEPLWHYGLLGAVVYYGVFFIGLLTIIIVADSINSTFIDETNDVALSFMGIPFGALAAFGVYQYLKNKWEREYMDPASEMDNIGSEIEEEQPLIR